MAPRFFIAVIAASTVAACSKTVVITAPAGERLAIEKGAFPHGALTDVLSAVVNERGEVDYAALRSQRRGLEAYLTALATTSPHQDPELFSTDAHKLAYWINGYNAYVLFAVTERPALRSVYDHKTDFFYFTKYRFGNQALSLYSLENDVIRAEFNEPRIHFALNCASASCPRLPRRAFLPEILEAQLAHEARAFCARPDSMRIKDGTVQMSKIFDWYAKDFEPDGAVAFCRRWGREDLPTKAAIELIPYDWSLNSQTTSR